ncbi:hypothetical protein TNCV_562961 [Trichonephila clavipes]|nr:hypothetical protein TNCV_562961 [Trichonephila clavipes]
MRNSLTIDASLVPNTKWALWWRPLKLLYNSMSMRQQGQLDNICLLQLLDVVEIMHVVHHGPYESIVLNTAIEFELYSNSTNFIRTYD